MPGLRLALTTGLAAPYTMSARTVFDHHQVPYVPVEQVPAGMNEELVAWTGHRNAPVAVYEDEPPRTGWLDILNLAERLGSGPSLIPEDADDRMRMIGLANELIGENGWLWLMRIVMLGFGGPERAAQNAVGNPMYDDYGFAGKDGEVALAEAKASFAIFERHAATRAGHDYLIGDRLSALDIYWAYFSQLRKTLPEEVCDMRRGTRQAYDMAGQVLGPLDPALLERRDFIFREHIGLPLVF